MEDQNIGSSEDLSLYSDAYGSSLHIEPSLRYTPHCNIKGNRFLSTFSESPRNENIFSQAFKETLRKNTDLKGNREFRPHCLSNSKNLLRISAQKLKLMNRQQTITAPFSPKSTRKLSPLKKRHQKTTSKNQGKKPKEISLKTEPETKKCRSDERAAEMIEIEVFMPIIDNENNNIYYPSSIKPVIRRYSGNKKVSQESKELGLENKYRSKNINEIIGKKILSNSRVKENPKEIVSKVETNEFENKSEAAKTTKKAPIVEKRSPMKELKYPKDSGSENEKVAIEFRNILQESAIVFDASDSASKKNTNSTVPMVSISRIIPLPKDSIESQDNFYAVEVFKNQDQVSKCVKSNLSVGIRRRRDKLVSNVSSSSSCDSGFVKESLDYLKKVEALASKRIKISSSQVNAVKSVSQIKISGTKQISNNKSLSREENAILKSESNFSVNKELVKNKSDETGWRRPLYTYSKNISLNNWRGRFENADDGLTIESWLDRCKYLRARDEFLGKCQSSRWRSS